MAGYVTRILVAATSGEPMQSREEVRTTRDGLGLEGDRYALGTGHWSEHRWDAVTLVSEEALEEVAEMVGRPLDPLGVRRNLVTKGVDLEGLVGRTFRVGDVILRGTRPCEPCRYLEGWAGVPGLRAALEGRGGLRAEILEGGVIRRGDRVESIR